MISAAAQMLSKMTAPTIIGTTGSDAPFGGAAVGVAGGSAPASTPGSRWSLAAFSPAMAAVTLGNATA